ncbi:MAG: M20/M25/M40 family metallo-hydrolase, partial [Clostridiales bacterium]|nr:M20/M25/M40 family metallo-hydrolase [Clostridiales bacterium]
GGHSGTEINKGHGNANLLMGRILYRLSRALALRIVSCTGGLKDNAIALACTATLALSHADALKAQQLADAFDAALKHEFAASDPGVCISFNETGVAARAMTVDDSARFARFLSLMPDGVAAMSMDIEGLVQTSCNLGVLQLENGQLHACSAVRSSVATQKQMLLERITALAETFGGSVTVTGDYPAWEYRRESVLRETMVRVFEAQYGYTPKVEAIHAGLECGLFAGKLDGLDAVSFGPNLYDIHTTRERMSISSVQRTWQYLCRVLEALK